MFDDEDLLPAQEKAWKYAWHEFYKSNGVENDYRGRRDAWGNRKSGYLEGEDPANAVNFGDKKVYEPCNAASNLAFYRGVARICDYPGKWNMK